MRVNVGDGLRQNGVFKAPLSGYYFFAFNGVVMFLGKEYGSMRINLEYDSKVLGYVNHAGSTRASGKADGQKFGYQSVSIQRAVYLSKDDTLWVKISEVEGKAYLTDGDGYFTGFTGFLLEKSEIPPAK